MKNKDQDFKEREKLKTNLKETEKKIKLNNTEPKSSLKSPERDTKKKKKKSVVCIKKDIVKKVTTK